MGYRRYAGTVDDIRRRGVMRSFEGYSVLEIQGHTGHGLPGVYPTHKGILPVVGNIEAVGIITGTDVGAPLKTFAPELSMTDALRHGNYSSGQVFRAVNTLKQDRYSREAVIQLFSARYFDTRCVHTVQFMPCRDRLDMYLSMGKVDAWRELPYILHSWGIIHRIVSACLGRDVGAVKTFTGSIYIHRADLDDVWDYLDNDAPESPITLSDGLFSLLEDVHDGKITFGDVQEYMWNQLYHAKDSDWSL